MRRLSGSLQNKGRTQLGGPYQHCREREKGSSIVLFLYRATKTVKHFPAGMYETSGKKWRMDSGLGYLCESLAPYTGATCKALFGYRFARAGARLDVPLKFDKRFKRQSGLPVYPVTSWSWSTLFFKMSSFISTNVDTVSHIAIVLQCCPTPRRPRHHLAPRWRKRQHNHLSAASNSRFGSIPLD